MIDSDVLMRRVDVLTTTSREFLRPTTQATWRAAGFEPVYHINDDQHPGVGRNRILQEFYASDREWLIMSDDDVIIDSLRGDYAKFVQDPAAVLDIAAQADIATFGIMNNIVHRVATTLENPAVATNWVFMRSYSLSNIFFHRRTRYIAQNETAMLEDQQWCMDQLAQGLRCACLMNLVLKSITTPSLLFDNNAERTKQYEQAKKQWAGEYPLLTVNRNGRTSKMRMINYYWRKRSDWHSVPGIGVAYVG